MRRPAVRARAARWFTGARALALAGACLTAAAAAQVEQREVLRMPDGETVYAPADGVRLPAFPRREDLHRIATPSGAAGREYHVDEGSISVSRDGVVYYTAVIRSSAGVNNVVYEAMDCRGRRARMVAYATPQGRFKAFERQGWRTFSAQGPTAYRYMLWHRYLCTQSHGALSPTEVVERLRRPTWDEALPDYQRVQGQDS